MFSSEAVAEVCLENDWMSNQVPDDTAPTMINCHEHCRLFMIVGRAPLLAPPFRVAPPFFLRHPRRASFFFVQIDISRGKRIRYRIIQPFLVYLVISRIIFVSTHQMGS